MMKLNWSKVARFLMLLFKKEKSSSHILYIEPKSKKDFKTKITPAHKKSLEEKQNEGKPTFLDFEKDRHKIAEMAAKYGLNTASVLAVAEVESGGRSGFQKNGLLTVLFEAHKFYAELKKARLNPDVLMVKYPNLISSTWNRNLYRGGDHENSRLAEALKIHECAWNCASYGMFQIMGFNHKICSFNTVKEFIEYLKTGQEAHIDTFLRFVSANPKMINALKNKDWTTFARLYNGPGYAQNKYDIKLAKAYENYNT